jgi:hypothetical protein
MYDDGTIGVGEEQRDDDIMLAKVGTLMAQLKQNQELQNLANANGLDVKNSIKLTEATANNIAVSVLSLLLAKRSKDPRYDVLVKTGIEKLSLKADIVNSYKEEANRLINAYRAKVTPVGQ